MRKRKLLVSGAVVVLLAVLLLTPTLVNNWRSNQLASHLASADLPSGASLLQKGSRVFNGGNGDGCDYQGFVIVSYWGEASDLRQAFFTVLDNLSTRHAVSQIVSDPLESEAAYGAKILGESTELFVRPNIDYSPLYLVSLTHSARASSLDLRCT